MTFWQKIGKERGQATGDGTHRGEQSAGLAFEREAERQPLRIVDISFVKREEMVIAGKPIDHANALAMQMHRQGGVLGITHPGDLLLTRRLWPRAHAMARPLRLADGCDPGPGPAPWAQVLAEPSGDLDPGRELNRGVCRNAAQPCRSRCQTHAFEEGPRVFPVR